jgi:adenine-specific DNA-methyltransferase
MPTLNWHKREEAVRAATRAPYRLLEPVVELSYGDADSENLLIQGDNLDALKALLPYYAGRVRCIAIDPPYNTQSAFEHYDDNLEHSTWLSLMYPRLELLRDLLAELDGDWWLGGGALTDVEKALIEQRFRDLEANPHASGPWEEAKLRLMAPFEP